MIKYLFTTLILLLGLVAPTTGQVTHASPDNGSRSAEMKAALKAHKAEIKTLEEDSTLDEEQKAMRIKQKKQTFRARMAITRGLTHHNQNRQTERAAIKKRLKTIKANPKLSREEKAARRAAYLAEKATTIREGKYPSERIRKKAASTNKSKKKYSDMTAEERLAVQKEIKQAKMAAKDKHKWIKDERYPDYERNNTTAPARKLTARQKRRALSSLDHSEETLKKDLKNGKITQKEADQMLARISEVRKQVINAN